MKLIGLTGGPGTGKSTVAEMFEKLGAPVFNADRAVHEFLARRGSGHRKVVAAFGKKILDERGEIDRRKLGKIVFGNTAKRRKLEGIVHPYVGRAMRQWAARQQKRRTKIAVAEVPLLFEAGFDKWVDVTMVVSAGTGQQVERLGRRSKISRQDARTRIAAQVPLKEKVLLADYVVDNRGSRASTRRQVINIWKELNGN